MLISKTNCVRDRSQRFVYSSHYLTYASCVFRTVN